MNFDELAKQLSDLYTDLRSGKVEPALAHELNATALNIQGVIRLGLLNAKLRNETPNLEFFSKKGPE